MTGAPAAVSRPSGRTGPPLIADALVTYQRRHRLDDAALARWLGIAIEDLMRLALCERPDPLLPSFGRDARRTAAYAGCDVVRLVLLLTEPAGDNAPGHHP